MNRREPNMNTGMNPCRVKYDGTSKFYNGKNIYLFHNSYGGTNMYFQVYRGNMYGRYVPPTTKRYGAPNYFGAKLPAAYYGYSSCGVFCK